MKNKIYKGLIVLFMSLSFLVGAGSASACHRHHHWRWVHDGYGSCYSTQEVVGWYDARTNQFYANPYYNMHQGYWRNVYNCVLVPAHRDVNGHWMGAYRYCS